MILLTVPYAQKDEAKALGARWNPTRRRWYVPDGAASEPFSRWFDAEAADDAPAPATVPSRKGRVDSYQGKTVVGANYLDLEHGCDPLQDCQGCAERLAGTPWAQAHAAVLTLVSGLPGESTVRTLPIAPS